MNNILLVLAYFIKCVNSERISMESQPSKPRNVGKDWCENKGRNGNKKANSFAYDKVFWQWHLKS